MRKTVATAQGGCALDVICMLLWKLLQDAPENDITSEGLQPPRCLPLVLKREAIA